MAYKKKKSPYPKQSMSIFSLEAASALFRRCFPLRPVFLTISPMPGYDSFTVLLSEYGSSSFDNF